MDAIRLAGRKDLERCVEIVRTLPDYFTPDVPDKVRSDWTRCATWVGEREDRVLGMVMVERRSAKTAEILWAAVQAEHRGGGLGTALVNEVIGALGREGVELLEVKTLDESADYEPYVVTVAFWERRGFFKLDVINPLPGWHPGNPCAIYVQALHR
jgi:GNAT superfamily N-acetyltransferase